jgi:tRNA modification GTPase
VDTAGLREATDRVERLGVELAERWVRRAHAVLACGETAADVAATAARVAALTDAPVVGVWTKSDLRDGRPPDGDVPNGGALPVSAESGAGLAALLDAVVRAVAARYGAPAVDAPVVTRARHRRALEEARDELSAFAAAWAGGHLPAPVAAVHLRAAVSALESVIGAVDVEDVLGRVFGDFCVGK